MFYLFSILIVSHKIHFIFSLPPCRVFFILLCMMFFFFFNIETPFFHNAFKQPFFSFNHPFIHVFIIILSLYIGFPAAYAAGYAGRGGYPSYPGFGYPFTGRNQSHSFFLE